MFWELVFLFLGLFSLSALAYFVRLAPKKEAGKPFWHPAWEEVKKGGIRKFIGTVWFIVPLSLWLLALVISLFNRYQAEKLTAVFLTVLIPLAVIILVAVIAFLGKNKKAYFLLQVLLTFSVIYLLLPGVVHILPGGIQKLVTGLEVMRGPVKSFFAVVFAFVALIIGWRWKWPLKLGYLALLTLAVLNAYKGYINPPVRMPLGPWGNRIGGLFDAALVEGDVYREGCTITFDTESAGPCPTGIVGKRGQWLNWKVVSLEPYRYYYDQNGDHWVTVRGDTLSNGRPMYAQRPYVNMPIWFLTRDAPVGSFVYCVGDGVWSCPFVRGQNYLDERSGPVDNTGEIWVYINDTKFRNDDTPQCHLDNQGVVKVWLQIKDPPGYALFR